MLQLVQTDLCGPTACLTKDGGRYYVTFTYDCSRYTRVYILVRKSDTLAIFKKFKAEAEARSGHKLKQLRSDGGGE